MAAVSTTHPPGDYLKGKFGYRNACRFLIIKGLEGFLWKNSVTCEMIGGSDIRRIDFG
jgi:hypothetical protein